MAKTLMIPDVRTIPPRRFFGVICRKCRCSCVHSAIADPGAGWILAVKDAPPAKMNP